MKCTIHGIEMEYAGEDPFGGDIWFCENCHAEEEAEFERTSEPYEYDEDLDDDGVYAGDVVIYTPYDDEDDE